MDAHTSDQRRKDAAAKAVQLLGGPVKAARRLGIERYQTVQSWVSNGIPLAHCARVERALDGAVSRRDMQPDDWHEIWPELATADAQAGEVVNG